jgi:hypothetical protein
VERDNIHNIANLFQRKKTKQIPRNLQVPPENLFLINNYGDHIAHRTVEREKETWV